MKAIRVHKFGEPEVMQLENIAEPTPNSQQLKISVKAVGVNPVDTYIRSGVYPISPELPYTPGKDAAGIVTEIGSEINNFSVGDRVYVCGCLTGSYAEYLLCEMGQVFHLPDNIGFSEGATLGVPYSTAYYALNFRAHALPEETLLVHGASGSVGLAAVQIAKSNGLKVIGTAGSDEGLKLLAEQGVFAALNHNSDNYMAEILELTDGRGVDVILEMLANVNLNNDLDTLAQNGRVVVIGSRGPIEIDPRKTMGKNSAILGMSLFNLKPQEMEQIHAAIRAGLVDSRYIPLIRCELPLSEAPKAHELVLQNGSPGKIILTI